jgi:RNA polymerase sigma-70 factor (ECF subfamily)
MFPARRQAAKHFAQGLVPAAVSVPDEEWLIQHAREGQRQAFAHLVEQYWDRLYRWLYHLCHDRHNAEDLTQEAFLRALGGLESFQPGSNFQAWLFRIAHNNFVNQQRGSRRVRLALPEYLPCREEGPVEEALSRETMQLLTRAVGRLPSDFRAAFLLRVEEDLSFRQIAEILQISEETARWRVFKARKKLMETLASHLDEEKRPHPGQAGVPFERHDLAPPGPA